MSDLGGRSQQKVSGEETHTDSLLVGSSMSIKLAALGKRKAMLMFAMRKEDFYLCCKCQLTQQKNKGILEKFRMSSYG